MVEEEIVIEGEVVEEFDVDEGGGEIVEWIDVDEEEGEIVEWIDVEEEGGIVEWIDVEEGGGGGGGRVGEVLVPDWPDTIVVPRNWAGVNP